MDGAVAWDHALNERGDVEFIWDGSHGPFRCVHCNYQMVAARGDINAHHFRHKPGAECSGSEETALHSSLKHRIQRLASKFGIAEVERAIGPYIADVRFNERWAFEVVVGNPPSEEKIRDLGRRMVLFDTRKDDWEQNHSEYVGVKLEDIVEDLCMKINQTGQAPICSKCNHVEPYASGRNQECNDCMDAQFQRWRTEHPITQNKSSEESFRERLEKAEAERRRDETKILDRIRLATASRQGISGREVATSTWIGGLKLRRVLLTLIHKDLIELDEENLYWALV